MLTLHWIKKVTYDTGVFKNYARLDTLLGGLFRSVFKLDIGDCVVTSMLMIRSKTSDYQLIQVKQWKGLSTIGRG